MVAVPSFMSANAKRGLKLLEYAGDGLQPKTVREARAMASGDVTAEKVRRIAAWFARHIVDLDSPKADDYLQGRSERPTPGQVAWLLWGGDLGSAQRLRGQKWAERKRDQLIAEGELSKEISKEISAAVRDGLNRKVKEHNEAVNNAKGKRVTFSMLEQVFDRGVGAYRTNPSSVRPSVTGPEQWAYARVNGFLSAVRTGKYKSGKFDTDLLPEGHPLKSNNENKTASAPATLTNMMYMNESSKGSYEMDDEADPLQHLLDAYGASVRSNMPNLMPRIMEAIEMIRGMYQSTEAMMPMMKNGTTYHNPVKCLLNAYSGLIDVENTNKVRALIMEIIHDAEQMMYGEENEDDSEEPAMGNEDGGGMVVVNDNADSRRSVYRTVQQEDGQYCVYSETGRAFGCYTSDTEALARLAQIERFSADKLVSPTVKQLVDWHNAMHKQTTITPAMKLVHDLIEDQLESRGQSRPYEITSDEKLSLLVDKSADVVTKANEQRYTLGPWYVPGTEDAHGEFTDSETLQKALWEWVRKGDRTIYLQHSAKPAGEMVEIMTVPFPVEANLTVPNQGVTKFKFPAETPFMGVVWEPWAWEMVKAGTLRGYSIGGTAKRMTVDMPELVVA